MIKQITLYLILLILVTGCGTQPSISQSQVISDLNDSIQQTEPQEVIALETISEANDEPLENDKDFIIAKVTRVIDGDTIEVNINEKKETVRMILIDTPETKKPNTPVQPYGPEASAFTKEQLEDKEVRLEFDVSERDRYGRLLAYVYIGDKMHNELLLEKGLARVAVFPPDVKYVDRFRELQKAAQEVKVGIWSIEDYVSDKGYNMKNGEEKTKEEVNPASTNLIEEVYYPNCAAVRAAGKAPLHKGDPGYRKGLDRDGDGIACE